MLAIIDECGALDAGCFPTREPQLAGVGYRDAATVGGVNAGADIDGDLRMIGIGIALAGEGLEMSPPELVRIIDDPGLSALAAIGFPAALANRHVSIISNY